MAMAARSIKLISEKNLVNGSNCRSAVRCNVMERPCLLTRCTEQISLRQLNSGWVEPDRAGIGSQLVSKLSGVDSTFCLGLSLKSTTVRTASPAGLERKPSFLRAQSTEVPSEPAPPAKPFHWTDLTKNANKFLPQAVVISTALGLFYPPSFAWFTNKYYPSALGFLMFAVGVNLSLDDFKHAFQRPGVIALGYVGQFALKPLIGYALAHSLVPSLGLPEAIGSGLILAACVSGAQLSNYAAFLVDKNMAPLSIVMTALSTATAALITPVLTQMLLGQRLPVDVKGMMVSILQCVIAPIGAGLALNRFARPVSAAVRPVLPLLSVLDTCCCIGSPLALNALALRSPFGLTILVPVLAFHVIAFVAGYYSAVATFPKAADRRSVARTVSFEIGMQSSLLALALANRFFSDPLVALPCAISVITMSLMAFGLVVIWTQPPNHVI